jgi:hypothetical protein
MNIQQAKEIKLTDYLSALGHQPKRCSKSTSYYLSPLHAETKPSFKVNFSRNQWYDFAIGKGGNIIALAQLLYNTDDVGAALQHIAADMNNPKLWNPRESRLDGKSKEAVEVNAKIDKLLLAINSAYESLVERKTDFDAKAIKDLFQCSADTQMTLLKQLDAIIADIESRIGIDYKKGTLPNYQYTRLTLVLFVKKRYGTDDVAFGELDEQFIREYMDFCLDERGLALDTVRIGMAVEKVLFIAVIQFTASYYFRLIALVGFLEEQPQFVDTANATNTVSEGAFIALG